KYVGAVYLVGSWQSEHKNLADLESMLATIVSRSGDLVFAQEFGRQDGIEEAMGIAKVFGTILDFNPNLAFVLCDDPLPPRARICPCCRELGDTDLGFPILPKMVREDLLRDRGYIR